MASAAAPTIARVELCDARTGAAVQMWVCTDTTAAEMLRLTSQVFGKSVSGFLTCVPK